MKLRTYRIFAIVTAVLFLFGAYRLYRGDFLSLSTPERQVEAIRGYCSADETGVSLQATVHPVVVHDETVGSTRVLVFTDEKIGGLLGHIQFRRGILGGWQPLSASYSAGAVVRSATLKNQENIRVVYAADCPAEVARYVVQADPDEPETLMAEGAVDSPAFFHVHKTDRNYFPDIHLFDAAGNELDSWEYLASDQSVPSPSIGSAETNLVYWFCGVILLVGWVIVRYLWDGGQPRKPAMEKEPS